MKHVEIIILAGGKGTRMESDGPKALVKLKGKPFLRHVTDTLKKLDLPRNPIIVIGYMAEDVATEMGDHFRYAKQHEQLGSGHAVLSAKSVTHPEHTTVFVSYTDHPLLKAETIRKIIDRQQETGSVIVMGTAVVPDFLEWRANFEKFARIKRDSQGNLIGLVEYKDASEEERALTEVNPAYFAFDADWMWANLEHIGNNNAQKEYYLTELVNIALSQGKRIETVQIDPKEALGANSKAELEVLESLI